MLDPQVLSALRGFLEGKLITLGFAPKALRFRYSAAFSANTGGIYYPMPSSNAFNKIAR